MDVTKDISPKEGGIAGSTVARVRDVHPIETLPSPKLVTLSGKVIEVRDVHNRNSYPKL